MLSQACRNLYFELAQLAGPQEGAAGEAPVAFKDLDALPKPVLRYFRYCLQEGQRPIKFCALKQKGAFRYGQLVATLLCMNQDVGA